MLETASGVATGGIVGMVSSFAMLPAAYNFACNTRAYRQSSPEERKTKGEGLPSIVRNAALVTAIPTWGYAMCHMVQTAIDPETASRPIFGAILLATNAISALYAGAKYVHRRLNNRDQESLEKRLSGK